MDRRRPVVRAALVLSAVAAAAFAQAPSNDTPAGATFVVDPVAVPDDNTNSAVDGPFPGCGAPAKDLWYFFVPSTTGTATVTTCPASGLGGGGLFGLTDSIVGVFSDSGAGPGGPLACNDDGCSAGTIGLESTVSFPVFAGSGVYVSVSGFNGAVGPYVVEFSAVSCSPPANDLLANATPVSGVTFSGTNACANANGFGSQDVYYSLVVMGPKQLTISNTIATTFQPNVGIYDNLGGGGYATPASSATLGPNGSVSLKITDCLTHTLVFAVSTASGTPGNFGFSVSAKVIFKITKPSGVGSLRVETHDGPAGALMFAAATLDVLHAGLPPAQSFPNGWWFGVPMGFVELLQQSTNPGGLNFVAALDPAGYALHFDLPAGTLLGPPGLYNLWIVGVAFDPATGFATVADVTDPETVPIP